jgi:phage virion morphogenesis protein
VGKDGDADHHAVSGLNSQPVSGVSTRLTGLEAALASLGQTASRAQYPRGLYENIGMSLVASTQRRFQAGSGPEGSPWPPSIRALAEGGKTLIDSARLMQSITFEASDNGVDVGTNVVYAAIHQLGGAIHQAARQQVIHFKRNSKTGRSRFAKANAKATFAQKVGLGARTIVMPARPFLGIDEDDQEQITALASEWLLKPRDQA